LPVGQLFRRFEQSTAGESGRERPGQPQAPDGIQHRLPPPLDEIFRA
jgi:hypothetical protein